MARGSRKALAALASSGPLAQRWGCAGPWAGCGRCHVQGRIRPQLLPGLEGCWGPWEGCSAPARMGLEEGRAVMRRGMRHSRGHTPFHKLGIICRGIREDLGNDPHPEQEYVLDLDSITIACNSWGCQPVLHDLNCPKLSQSLACHHLCLWVELVVNQEKSRSNPRLFWKVGFATEMD